MPQTSSGPDEEPGVDRSGMSSSNLPDRIGRAERSSGAARMVDQQLELGWMPAHSLFLRGVSGAEHPLRTWQAAVSAMSVVVGLAIAVGSYRSSDDGFGTWFSVVFFGGGSLLLCARWIALLRSRSKGRPKPRSTPANVPTGPLTVQSRLIDIEGDGRELERLMPVWSVPANRATGSFRQVGGRLDVRRSSIAFEPRVEEIASGMTPDAWGLAEISDIAIEPRTWTFPFRRRLRLELADGGVEVFIVNHLNDVIARVQGTVWGEDDPQADGIE